MEIEYLGHSAFALRDGPHEVLIDPFLSESPTAPASALNVRPTFILVTHAHGDHLGDAVELSKKHRCPIIAMNELGIRLEAMGVEVVRGNIGGEFALPFGRVKMFPALHSSSFDDGTYAGPPCSFLVTMGEVNIFHAGDTALFGDMSIIGDETNIDVALVPVGGVYTMGARDAVKAARLLRPRRMVPMHYDTWKEIELDHGSLRKACEGQPFELAFLRPGELLRI